MVGSVLPLKAAITSNTSAGLNRWVFLARVILFFAVIQYLGVWLHFEWPLLSIPFVLSLALAAVFHGADRGIQGLQCGPPEKSWVLARKMVSTGVIGVLGFTLIALVDKGTYSYVVIAKSGLYLAVELALTSLIALLLCRYGFGFGVEKGYALYLKKKDRKR